jgi:hypothetical protein
MIAISVRSCFSMQFNAIQFNSIQFNQFNSNWQHKWTIWIDSYWNLHFYPILYWNWHRRLYSCPYRRYVAHVMFWRGVIWIPQRLLLPAGDVLIVSAISIDTRRLGTSHTGIRRITEKIFAQSFGQGTLEVTNVQRHTTNLTYVCI